MTTKRKPTEAETRRLFQTMREAKAAEQAERANGVRIYTDAMLKVTVVVEVDGVLYLVPKSKDGWQRRQRLNMAAVARADGLTPARYISAAWLGIPNLL